MLPPLSDEFMYQIIFCMEDQANHYKLDLEDGSIDQVDALSEKKMADPERYLELPGWGPADGFRIMEKFVSSLRNPIFREKLHGALNQGKGVFRSFKNTLHEEPAIERLWFYFKEKELKRLIYVWYEKLSEALFLERLGEPEEDVSELILSDFIFSYDPEVWAEHIKEIGEFRLQAEFASVDFPLNEILIQEYQETWNAFDADWLMVFMESPDGDFAGFIGAQPLYPEPEVLVYSVKHVYVEPRYRGLGVFKMLSDELCKKALENRAERVIVELSGKSAVVAPVLEQRGFQLMAERFALDLSHWKKNFMDN